MMPPRKIKKIFSTKPTLEGAGVHLKRGFGYQEVPLFDPFLLFDDFSSPNASDYLPGFPWHPHRGIETVTYVLSGEVAHEDSLGHKGSIRAGDVQWMTAGHGIIHQEMPQEHKEGLKGFQLWVNLPAAHKMMPPRYRDVSSNTIQILEEDGIKVSVIAGVYKNITGPVRDLVAGATYIDVSLAPKKLFSYRVPLRDTAILYVLEGNILVGEGTDNRVWAGSLALLGPGEEITCIAKDSAARFLFISGTPLGEPVAWYGPMVMNTEQEIRQALQDYREGKF